MKIMYVAANPLDAASLMVEAEITELQSHAVAAQGEAVTFLSFPSLSIEQLPLELARQKPDILHISAHASNGKLELSKADRSSVELTGDTLRTFLDRHAPPTLVYVNACDSRAIADALVDREPARPGVPVAYAIGTTAPVTNRAARAAAALFYSRILEGYSIAHAFEGGKQLIERIQNASASAEILYRLSAPTEAFLYQKPLLVARFTDEDLRPHKRRKGKRELATEKRKMQVFDLEYGFVGLPASTTQVVLFTDDEDFLPEKFDRSDLAYGEEVAAASYLCRVSRSRSVRGTLWMEDGWQAYGDFRIAAAGMTAEGRTFAFSSMLTEALRRYYTGEGWTAEKLLPEAVFSAIQQLKAFDGA